MRSPEAPPGLAAAGLASVLVVVLVSAAIRLNGAGISAVAMFGDSGMAMLRGVHRSAASLELLAALALTWMAWRRGTGSLKTVGVVLALTAFLAGLGIVAGRTPSALQALGNLLGGLALAMAFASLLAEKGSGTFFLGESKVSPGEKRFLTPFLALLALQAVIGARLSLFGRSELPTLPLHALLGLGIAALLAWLALARIGAGAGRLLFVLALAAPMAGFTALHYEYSAAAALAHAASAALLIAAAAFALRRIA
jgi:hypothetical protein